MKVEPEEFFSMQCPKQQAAGGTLTTQGPLHGQPNQAAAMSLVRPHVSTASELPSSPLSLVTTRPAVSNPPNVANATSTGSLDGLIPTSHNHVQRPSVTSVRSSLLYPRGMPAPRVQIAFPVAANRVIVAPTSLAHFR